MRDNIFVWHFHTASTIDSLLVYSSFSTLLYMPPLTANDVQRVTGEQRLHEKPTQLPVKSFRRWSGAVFMTSQLPACVSIVAFNLVQFVQFEWKIGKKNVLAGDGCCWHAQCHRTKNLITRLMFCPPTRGTRCVAYRRLCHVLIKLQLLAPSHSVTSSRRPESKCMMPGHEQNYVTSSEHRIFELTIKQLGNLQH